MPEHRAALSESSRVSLSCHSIFWEQKRLEDCQYTISGLRICFLCPLLASYSWRTLPQFLDHTLEEYSFFLFGALQALHSRGELRSAVFHFYLKKTESHESILEFQKTGIHLLRTNFGVQPPPWILSHSGREPTLF